VFRGILQNVYLVGCSQLSYSNRLSWAWKVLNYDDSRAIFVLKGDVKLELTTQEWCVVCLQNPQWLSG